MFDLCRQVLLRINIAILHLVCSLSGASVPMTGIVTILLIMTIKAVSRQAARSKLKRT